MCLWLTSTRWVINSTGLLYVICPKPLGLLQLYTPTLQGYILYGWKPREDRGIPANSNLLQLQASVVFVITYRPGLVPKTKTNLSIVFYQKKWNHNTMCWLCSEPTRSGMIGNWNDVVKGMARKGRDTMVYEDHALFSVFWHLFYPFYTPQNVQCSTVHAVKLFAGVRLKLLGRAKVHWSEGSSDNSEDYKAKEIYVNEEIYLVGSCECILVH